MNMNPTQEQFSRNRAASKEQIPISIKAFVSANENLLRIFSLITGMIILTGAGGLIAYGSRGPVQGQQLQFRVLSNSQDWALTKDQPSYFVVTEKNWQNYYQALPAGADLVNNLYVVAYWGVKPNPGYRISLMDLRQAAGRVQIAVKHQEPEPGKVYAQVLVHPVAVAEVNKKSLSAAGKLTFQFLDQKGVELARGEVDV